MKFLGRLVGVLVALVLLAVVGVLATDGLVRSVAQDAVASNLERQASFTGRPRVTIEGWPFVYCLATEFPSAHVSGQALPMTVAGRAIALQKPDLTLTGVKARSKTVTARTLSGSVVLTYDDLTKLAGVKVGYAGPGRIAVTANLDVLGQKVDAVASGAPVLDVAAQTVTIGQPQISVAGLQLPKSAVDQLTKALVKPVAVPLQYGLKLAALTPSAAGVEAKVSGTDVTLPNG